MPPSHSFEKWIVSKKDHPGSSALEICNEPDWGITGHEHYTGYKNRQGRRPGHTEGDPDVDVREAWNKLQRTKREKEEGRLVNWKDAIQSEEDFSLRHPEGRPFGWRYVLDYTEDGIRQKQKWPINIKKREKREQDKQQKVRKDDGKKKEGQENEKQSDKQVDGPGNEVRDMTRDEKLRANYTPAQRALLRALEHEKEYMANLQTNDGTNHSNVQNRTTIAIDEADQFTPDNWIPRSDDLIRLTAKHPLNAEPPLTRLYEAGFITPNELFYVRNHGAVPRLLREYHRLKVTYDGKHTSFSMEEIERDFEALNIPVSIGCDNGRRKELNMVKRSKGFNWGPAACGCAYWKGPLLRDVLMAAGVPEHIPDGKNRRHWVHLRGADNPGAANYETSVPFEVVMDETNDVILAYEMNDVPLPPDHGYPIRVIIPGYVGGRQVKWLEEIWISDKENDSYYHIWDNRVVPSFITNTESELAMAMFHHPDTALYEQYLNSVITVPRQGEKIALKDVKHGKEYRIQGFAFNGHGDEIKRIEVTLDDGKTWLYCIRRFPEAPIRHGRKFWTWCFWHVDVDIGDLVTSNSIRVRAWDAKLMTQPEEPTWNIVGSMNNVQYAVKAEIQNDETPYFLFRHPVEPGNFKGGWMKESAENQIADASRKSDAPNKQFTRAEIEKHDKEDDCWIVVDNRVYDATSVLSWHPGGAAPIMMHAGAVHYDTTEEFSSLHDDYAYQKLNECVLGVVTDKAKKHIEKTKQDKEKDAQSRHIEDQALQKHRWVPTTMVARDWISRDTAVYTFKLADKTPHLGLGTCQHVEFGFHLKDKMLIRQYTPTKPVFPRNSRCNANSNDDEGLFDGTGTFEVTVKTYYPDDQQPGGALSNILAAMPIGEEIEIRGPTGDIMYKGDGEFSIVGKNRHFKRVSLVLGGTGLTPGFSLMARVCQDLDDELEIRVIDANKTEYDILLREDLDRLERMSRGRLKVTHVLSHAGDDWKGLRGHVTKEMMRQHLFEPSPENLALLCGPPAMIQKAVLPALQEWGYDQDKNLFGL
ncbi:hypothetical protein GGS21DRAFT_211187 [Xylaria nigripes]|nr:hypothetical protein GGS21DRAFT_211187 [Xylaria nigripes]